MSTSTAGHMGKPWWQMPHPPRRHPAIQGFFGKGEYGGSCNRIACDNKGAHWFNETNGRYYCAGCAATFNEVSRKNGQRPLCELHL